MNNFILRSISGIVYLAAILLSLTIHPLIFALLFAVFIFMMMREYFALSIPNSFKTGKVLSIISGLSIFCVTFFHYYKGLDLKFLLLSLLPILFIFISVLYKNNKEEYNLHPWLISAIIYIALPVSLYNSIIFDSAGEFSGWLLLGLFIIQWLYDIGAYIFGTAFGQVNGHRLFPSISPKKSWEGVIGGSLITIIAAIILSLIGLSPFSTTHSILIAVIISLFGTLGDLVESQIKRNFGVKDSGNIMPGHGGMLDRLDSALISIPVAIIYIRLLDLI